MNTLSMLQLLLMTALVPAALSKQTQLTPNKTEYAAVSNMQSQEFFIDFTQPANQSTALRLETRTSNANKSLLMVARQQDTVDTWWLPYSFVETNGVGDEIDQTRFISVGRTLCPAPVSSQEQRIRVHLTATTQSLEAIGVYVTALVPDFHLRLGSPVSDRLLPSSPRVYYFQFEDEVRKDEEPLEAVRIVVDSADDSCGLVSVQRSNCPVQKLPPAVLHTGYRQTFLSNAVILMRRDEYRSFFVVLTAFPSNQRCLSKSKQEERRVFEGKNFTMRLERVGMHHNVGSVLIGLAFLCFVVNILLGILVFLTLYCKCSYTENCYKTCVKYKYCFRSCYCFACSCLCNGANKYVKSKDDEPNAQKNIKIPLEEGTGLVLQGEPDCFCRCYCLACSCLCDGANKYVTSKNDEPNAQQNNQTPLEEGTGLVLQREPNCFSRCYCFACSCLCDGVNKNLAAKSKDDELNAQENIEIPLKGGNRRVAAGASNQDEPIDQQQADLLLEEGNRQVAAGASAENEPQVQQNSETNVRNPSSCLFTCQIIAIITFYGLPAVQLLLQNQLDVSSGGDMDKCYYNFKCRFYAKFAGRNFYAFNNFISNVGYLTAGVAYIMCVMLKQCQSLSWCKSCFPDKHSIPRCYSAYYGAGLALVMEGLLSAFYHVCPTHDNFQFDTAFMFMLSGMVGLALYCKRNPNTNMLSGAVLVSGTAVVLINTQGILLSNLSHEAAFDLVGYLMFFLTCLQIVGFIFSLEIQKLENAVFERFTSMAKTFDPGFWILMTILCSALSLAAFICGSCYIDISVAYLYLIFTVGVSGVYLICYLFRKFVRSEQNKAYSQAYPRAGSFKAGIVFGLLKIFFASLIIPAGNFFRGAPTDWNASPAESRARNTECLTRFLGLPFDKHDLWHLLGSQGIYCALLLVLFMDADEETIEEGNLEIF